MQNKYLRIGIGLIVSVLILLAAVEVVAYVTYGNSKATSSDVAVYNELRDKAGTSSAIKDASAATSSLAHELNPTSTAPDEPDSESKHDISKTSKNTEKDKSDKGKNLQTMMVAGGCFWCAEADMEKAPGVQAVLSGYAGGETKNPTYETYAEGGHREVVKVIYDSNQVSYEGLLYYFLKHIDPTDGKGQFVDRGEQYSPAIYYQTQSQKETAQDVLNDIASRDVFEEELKVPVLPETRFWLAENYHQDFYKKSVVRYKSYRKASGRDQFIAKHWGHDVADMIPEKAQVK